MYKVSWETLSCFFGLTIVSFNLISNCECLEISGNLPEDQANSPSNTYSTLVIIGDSYSDNGHLRPAEFEMSLSSPPSFGGRYSDGPVWAEYLAQSLSVETNVTFLDYAYNGAHIKNKLSNLSYPLPPDSAAQIQTYLNDLQQHAEQSAPIKPLDTRILHVLWIGINTLISIWRASINGNKSTDVHALLDSELVRKIDEQVAELGNQLNQLLNDHNLFKYETDYVLMTIPPLITTKLIRDAALEAAKGVPNLAQTHLKLCSDMTDHFNLRLIDKALEIKANIRDLAHTRRIAVFDTVELWSQVQSKPWMFGFDSTGSCLTDGHPCESPNRFMYWDMLHPSSHLHAHLSNAMVNFLEGLNE